MPDLIFKNRKITLDGPLDKRHIQFKNARVTEGLGKLTEITVEFLSSVHTIDLQDILGKPFTINVETNDDGGERHFSGTCISAEHVGLYQGLSHIVAELRTWPWYLTRTQENRIFQEKSALEIIKDVIGDYGFSGDITDKTSATYEKRDYTVQYRETDFDFICRLMEQEGIYFYFEYASAAEKLVLADGISAHSPIEGETDIEFHYRDGNYRRRLDHVFDWTERTATQTGKVTLNDYDFESPKADQKKAKTIAKGKHSHKNYELYRYPGFTRPITANETHAKVMMEAEAVKHMLYRGAANVRTFTLGSTFRLKEHPRKANNQEYLLVGITHHLQVETDYEDHETKKPLIPSRVPVDDDNKDTYRCVFDVIPKSEQFRMPLETPWPEIAGLQTATVMGPDGEEVYTDEYGRIKVKFHWDRDSEKSNENKTCYIRCAMPWTGKDWGFIAIPRMGQEVVIQFEDGNPDRPICTGMLYNADTKPPYALDANKTQTGIKTRSTKSGGSDNYNELVFEDKKDNEFVRLQSEKDYTEIIKNNATITIGLEKKDEGNLTQTIYNNKTETLQEGDHTFTVEKGNQTIFVKADHTETIEGTSTQTITGDTTIEVSEGNYEHTVSQGDETHTVSQGDYSQTVSQGDVTREVSQGSETKTISLGDWTVDVSSGSIAIEAGTEICLTVGGNSITIDMSGITISGTMVTIEGEATAEMSSPSTTVSGDGMLTLDGGVTMIN